jgi:GTPase SAR1 family protein
LIICKKYAIVIPELVQFKVIQMDLILGVAGSGKTTLGETLASELKLNQYCSKIGKLSKRNKFKFYKVFNFNWLYIVMTQLLTSQIVIIIASVYCSWLINKDQNRYLKSCLTNSIQISLRSSRVFSFVYTIDKSDKYSSLLLTQLKRSRIQFNRTIILTTNNKVHIDRIAKRGYTLFVFDYLVLLGGHYEQQYLKAAMLFANVVSRDVLVIDTTDFESSNRIALQYIASTSTPAAFLCR